jgi:predicted transcriptional regulator
MERAAANMRRLSPRAQKSTKFNGDIRQICGQLTECSGYVIERATFRFHLHRNDRPKGKKKMAESDKISAEELLRMTSEVTAAYVSNNSLAAAQLPEIIRTIHASLVGLQSAGASAEPPTPAVPIKKSVHDDYIVCLEDGKKLKMLKRHLRTAYGLTPEEYRQKWGLAPDYPMVAPNYAAQRSAFAKKIGLGRTGGRRKRGRR